MSSRDKLQEIDAEDFDRSLPNRVPTEMLVSLATVGGISPGLRNVVENNEIEPKHSKNDSTAQVELNSLRARVRDGDEEILRLAEQCKNFRTTASELQDRVVSLQSELNLIKLDVDNESLSEEDENDSSVSALESKTNPSSEKY